MKNHVRIHSGEKQYMCEVCAATFSQSEYWKKKHFRIHSRNKTYKCEVYSATFTQSGNLKICSIIHSGEKWEVCAATFRQSEHFWEKHFRIHSGEKPYKCEACSATFTQSGNLKIHSIVLSGEKPFKCEVCSVTFRQTGPLKSHLRNSQWRKTIQGWSMCKYIQTVRTF